MHPQQLQAVVAMIDGLTGQLGALRQMVAGALPPRRPAPPQQQQYLSDQEEQLLDQAVGVAPPQFQHQPQPQYAPTHAYPPQQPVYQPPPPPFQGYQQPMPAPGWPPQQPMPQQGYAQPQQPFQQPPMRPYHMPNNMGQQPAPDFAALAAEAQPANQRAVMEVFRAAAAGGVPLDPNQMQG